MWQNRDLDFRSVIVADIDGKYGPVAVKGLPEDGMAPPARAELIIKWDHLEARATATLTR